MKQLTKTFFIVILCVSGLSNCSTFAPFKVPVLQGNIIEREDINQLVKGLTKEQVQYLLGTPLLNSPIHPNRWDYFYSVTVGDKTIGEKKLSLVFNQSNKLDVWTVEESSLTSK